MESKRQLTREELLEMESAEDEDATYVGCGNLFLSVFCSDNYVFSILSDAGCRSEF